jgi:hypothetical protein
VRQRKIAGDGRNLMMGAQFDMMIGAHRQLFDRIDATNRLWLAVVQETNKSGSDLALHLIQCKDPAEAQALCDAWLRDCARRLTSFSRAALGSWLELQQIAPQGDVPEVEKQIQSPAAPGKGGTGRAERVAERRNA